MRPLAADLPWSSLRNVGPSRPKHRYGNRTVVLVRLGGALHAKQNVDGARPRQSEILLELAVNLRRL